MKKTTLLFLTLFLVSIGCFSDTGTIKKEIAVASPAIKLEKPKTNTATLILSKKEIPVLCYHNIRAIQPNASVTVKAYTVTPKAFEEQMKALSDAGYQTILPDELYAYLVYHKPLPAKPILITFDDTREEHFRLATPEMAKYGFKGVFFIMTVSIDRPGYMNKQQIKNLSDTGHSIGSHTWDHHRVTKYSEKDWEIQLRKPQQQLEAITGKPIRYFSYPFGLWNAAAIAKIKSENYKLAFTLATKRDTVEPLFTVRRMIVAGTWSTPTMLKAITTTFDK